MKSIASHIGFLMFWGFIAVKVGGQSFAAWSWWWVLWPSIPWAGLLITRLGL